MAFPTTRMRRLRATPALRRLVTETRLAPEQLVLPLFVCPGEGVRRPIASMPGCVQQSVDTLVEDVLAARDLGLSSVLLFGIPAHKDAVGSAGSDPEGPVPAALRALKAAAPDVLLWADVCLCEYTDHGHCGILCGEGAATTVDNDRTLDLLAACAVAYARAGADLVAPSDMMDGRVAHLRRALDAAGHADTPIVSYAAKFASAFYGPFREAAESAPRAGDRKSYQMDPANGDEALREVLLDVGEGADMVMVKPATAYLDVVHRVKEATRLPVVAYHVSGEYAMLCAAAERGWIDFDRVLMETLLGIRRAGADVIITYAAREALRLLARRG
jgi:porphobilinogen synthase